MNKGQIDLFHRPYGKKICRNPQTSNLSIIAINYVFFFKLKSYTGYGNFSRRIVGTRLAMLVMKMFFQLIKRVELKRSPKKGENMYYHPKSIPFPMGRGDGWALLMFPNASLRCTNKIGVCIFR